MNIIQRVLDLFPDIRFIMTVDAPWHLVRGENVLFICDKSALKEEKLDLIEEQTKNILRVLDREPAVTRMFAAGTIFTADATLYSIHSSALMEPNRFKGLKITGVCIIHR